MKSNGELFVSQIKQILFTLIIIVSFITSAQAEEVSFVVVSDLHLAEKEGVKNFTVFIKQIDELNPKPDFVVVTGDIHAKEFEKVFNELKPTIPFHVVFGNHEKRGDRKILAKMFPQDFVDNDFYSFVYKHIKCIVICDAIDMGDHVGHFESEGIKGQEQQVWFEKELNVDRKRYPFVFLFSHIPPNPAGKAETMYLSTNDQKALREIFLKYKPNAMFCGHLHKKQSFEIENVPIFILPSLNWNFEDNPAGFYHIKAQGNGYDVDFISLNIPAEK